MNKLTVNFIKAGLIYLVCGGLIGLHLAAGGPMHPFRAVHAHLNLLGWMNMMIFGVAYHIIPRFSGRPLWSPKMANWHFYLANAALIGMLFGWSRYVQMITNHYLLFAAAIVQFIAIILFVINIFKTIRCAEGCQQG